MTFYPGDLLQVSLEDDTFICGIKKEPFENTNDEAEAEAPPSDEDLLLCGTDPSEIEVYPTLVGTDPEIGTYPTIVETDGHNIDILYPIPVSSDCLVEKDSSLVETDYKLLESEPPLVDETSPLFETDPTLVHSEPSLVEGNFPPVGINPALVESETPLFDTVSLLTASESVLSKVEGHGQVVPLDTKVDPLALTTEGAVSCSECRVIFTSSELLYKHERRYHNNFEVHKCKQCDFVTNKKYYLTVHNRTHALPKEFKCDICGELFGKACLLRVHSRNHTKVRFPCELCGKKLSTPQRLERHKDTHIKDRPFICASCNKSFIKYIHLKTHQLTHTDEKPYKCRFCENAFIRNEAKMKHELEFHTLENHHTCQVCGRDFPTLKNMKAHHCAPDRDGTKKLHYTCNICDKQFNAVYKYESHMRSHTGEKPLQCGYCEVRFNHRESLQRHEISLHTGKYPHNCQNCGKGFLAIYRMKKHKCSEALEVDSIS